MIATQEDNREEMFPLVDEEGNIIGAATRGECHNGSKCLHPVVHLHVFNSRGELYLQKRPHWKDIQPGKMGHGRRRPRGLGRKRGDGLAPRSGRKNSASPASLPNASPAMCLNPTANVN